MKIGNNGHLVLGPFDESTPCLMIVFMNCQTKVRMNHLTAVKSVTILENFCEVWFLPESVARVAAIVGAATLPHASALIQRDFGCVVGVQKTKQLPHVAKADLVWQLGCNLGQSLSNYGPHIFYR
ncbi:hypothetical protein TNCV_1026271 [Trichonephila clavipes]|nr:hypothetical protein TNCV_1026271 [Trichonephila clavipes]